MVLKNVLFVGATPSQGMAGILEGIKEISERESESKHMVQEMSIEKAP